TQQELVVSATSEIGRIFTAKLSADDELTQSASKLLPEIARENMQYALWDIELMFFPLDSIAQTLPAEARIEDSNEDGKRVRKLFFKDELVVEIDFSDAQSPMFSETVVFRNFVRDYEYTMTLLP
ncbi:MAG: DUF3261 domain-containing protein, partial [Oscillospiraceae bacterium]|nr:DUF3261 domain-containing protein [Oscillospiraceae bacterium]